MTRRLAYADPPYPGTAHERYGDAGREVNVELLVAYLAEFDGWALSTSSTALRTIWNLAPHARVAAWAKTFAPNGWSRVRYSWEPVLFVTDHRGIAPGERSTVWDAHVSSSDCARGWREVDGKPGGAKPVSFTRWLLALLDWKPGDEFVDVFPGSGAVGHAVAEQQLALW
jgi:hypothetical protein